MSMTTCQKVTLLSCSVLCVSLFLPRMLLPRARQDTTQAEVGPGFYPPMMHQARSSQDPEQWGLDPGHSLTHPRETVFKVRGIAQKSNLMTQVIPIYGFGILLYILFIIHKLSCKGKPVKTVGSSDIYKPQLGHTLNEYELAKLQRRLLQTEQMMEMIVSGKSRGDGSGQNRKNRQSKKDEKLLRHLRQMAELMQEGRLEGTSPEMEAEEVPYFAGWEGYSEETFPEYEDELCHRKRRKRAPLVATMSQPTAEALAERMEQEEEEMAPRKLEVLHEEEEEELEEEEKEETEGIVQTEDDDEEVESIDNIEEEEEEEEAEEEEEEETGRLLGPPSPMLTSEKKYLGLEVSTELRSQSPGRKITFSEQRDVYRYPREDACEEDKEEKKCEEEEEESEDEEGEEEEVQASGEELATEEEDPLMEAESLLFSCDVGTNPEAEAEEETGGALSEDQVQQQHTEHSSGLRMRNRRDT